VEVESDVFPFSSVDQLVENTIISSHLCRVLQYSVTDHQQQQQVTLNDMAPPPPADMPLTQRVMALAQTLQFAWFMGHVTLLFCTVRYALSYLTFNYYSRWATFTYRTSFIAAAVTYGIVVYKAFRARARQGKTQQAQVGMLADENVHYLSMFVTN